MKDYSNSQQRVDSTSILPVIAEAVITCAREIPLQGHKQGKIDFDSPPFNNEGNLMAVLRLLAKNIPQLKEHLTSGP